MLQAIAIVAERVPGAKYSLKINEHPIEYVPESADAIIDGLAEKVRAAAGSARYTVYADDENDRIVIVGETAKQKLAVSTRNKQLNVWRFQVNDEATRSEVLAEADKAGAVKRPTAIMKFVEKPQAETTSAIIDTSAVESSDDPELDIKPVADEEVRDEPAPPEPTPAPVDTAPTPTPAPTPAPPANAAPSDSQPVESNLNLTRAIYRHAACQVTIIAPTGGTISGQYCSFGEMKGIAAETKSAGELTSLITEGVFLFTAQSDLDPGTSVNWTDGKISASSASARFGVTLDKIKQNETGRVILTLI